MKRRFVDAFYYIALINPRDEWHDRVLAFHRTLEGDLLTTDAVLTEVANTFSGSPWRGTAGAVIHAVRRSSDVIVLPVSGSLMDRGIDLYRARSDKAWSLTDCMSFVVMEDARMDEALTGDRHFVQAGFKATFIS